MMERICRECQRGDHDNCDSRDAIGNHDYCGPRPICACLGSDKCPV